MEIPSDTRAPTVQKDSVTRKKNLLPPIFQVLFFKSKIATPIRLLPGIECMWQHGIPALELHGLGAPPCPEPEIVQLVTEAHEMVVRYDEARKILHDGTPRAIQFYLRLPAPKCGSTAAEKKVVRRSTLAELGQKDGIITEDIRTLLLNSPNRPSVNHSFTRLID